MNRQRGALVFITPMIMVTIILLGVLTLDGARLYSLQQDMQSQVNVAATAAADAAQGCGGETITLAAIEKRALIAARAQGFEGTDNDLIVQPGVIESDESKVLSFEAVSDLLRSNGVAVSYEKKVPISVLLPESTFGKITIGAKAAARKELIATFSGAGSTVVLGATQQTANLLNIVLGAILNNGTPFTIDPTDFSSLAQTTSKLGTVLDDLGVSSIEEMLSTEVLVSDLLRALKIGADPVADVGGVLDQLVAGVGVDTDIKLADVIKVVGTTEVPRESQLPLYDTVIALALNLVEGQLIENLTHTSINIPGVTKIQLDLFIGRAPAVVTGPARQSEEGEWITRFHAPDISLMLTSDLDVLGLLALQIPLSVEVGGGAGEFVWASCATGSSTNSVTVGVDVHGNVATLATGYIDADGHLDPQEITLSVLKNTLPGSVSLAEIRANLFLGLGGGTEQLELGYTLNENKPSPGDTKGGLSEVDFKELDVTVELLPNEEECSNFFSCFLDSIGDVLSELIEGITDLIGLEDLIQDIVEGLVESLATTVIEPLLNALGVSLGTVNVQVTGAHQNHVQLLEYCGPEGC